MDATENLALPYILPSQAQKHVTHNEAIKALDAVVQLAVTSRSVATPPPPPAAGVRYIVPAGATGAWAGREKHVAAWQDGVWVFYMPRTGWLAYAVDENVLLTFGSSDWALSAFNVALPDRLGLNATATAPNRLALAGDASLFTHEGAGHQLKINKAAATDTASILFQTAFSGRAEIGTAGSDDFRLKVSANGSTFVDAVTVDRNSGRVSFPAGATGLRIQLTAARTYYVATTGNDSNTGLSAGAAFATLQKAVDEAHKLDCASFDVTIQLANGTYAAGATVARSLIGGGTLIIKGNETTPASVVLSSGLSFRNGAQVRVAGLRFVIATDLIHALSVGNGVYLRTGKLEFGAVGANADHIFADNPCHIAIEEDYTISGGGRRHMNIGMGYVVGANRTITLTGTPAFTHFLAAANCASIALSNLTVSGTATGSRYIAETNGVINTYGKATTYLPGSTVGTNPTGGIYA
ncbi:DUF2793 domain-containing protein [Shinella sp. M31]|uniref:DUF2793 domain-containing protein n=1 Tax=Shinella sp. M31 TaxID=3368615 RepID=UPI003B9F7A2D